MNAASSTRCPEVRGVLRFDVPLAEYTAWALGGTADQVFEPADVEDLSVFLRELPANAPVLWVGLGSNLLVRDGGVRGTVIHIGRGLGTLAMVERRTVRAGAGVPCAKLARFCASASLAGGEFFAGIPGTVGGALAMNAGAFGGETWPLVTRVETIDRAGNVRWRDANAFTYAYRHLEANYAEEEWFTSGEFRLAPGSADESRAQIRSLLKQRASSQPTGQRSCGSVFKNPPGDYAGRLIEATGLKGTRVGGARVSEEHANFIINDGDASAADVEALIASVRERVEASTGVTLEAEVRLVGEAAS